MTEAALRDEPADVVTAPAPHSIAELLDDASVLVTAGAGGVGKTTTAAALALAVARRGRRAVVVTIDPAKRLADAIGVTLSHEPTPVSGVGPGELWAMMLDTRATFDGIVRRYATDDTQAERILGNRFYRNIAGSLSGTQEYMAAEQLYQLHHDDRFDVVVVDTPPTRNALDFLDAPARLVRFLDHRLYRVLVTPTRIGMRVANVAAQLFLKTVTKAVGAEVIADAITFFKAFDGMEAGFRQRADAVIALLRSDETKYILVTSPRREAVEEATFFADELSGQGLLVAAVIANRVHPEFPEPPDKTGSGRAADRALLDNFALLRQVAGSERAALGPIQAAAGAAAFVEVALLDHDVHDLASLGEVADIIVR
jgi:anion-transporting  ArsA/GET3 family ATPase